VAGDPGLPARRVTDAHGDSWRIGTEAEVAWIAGGTSPGLAVTAAIPPVFAAYAALVLPESAAGRERHNRAVLALLGAQPAGESWWLGYLRTSPSDMVLPGVPMAALPAVALYSGQDYVLVEAGPRQAATWRRSEAGALWWRDVLPDLMFPAGRSWLVSTLCDDDWSCAGGPASLVDAFLAHPDVRARQVRPGMTQVTGGRRMRQRAATGRRGEPGG
jgi:hypothetical protein